MTSVTPRNSFTSLWKNCLSIKTDTAGSGQVTEVKPLQGGIVVGQKIASTLRVQEAAKAQRPVYLGVREAIEMRYSARTFMPRYINEEDLIEILRLVSLAPSAWNLQPWRFFVVRSPELKCYLHEATYNQEQITSAPVVIVLYSDMKDALEHVDEVIHPDLPAEMYDRYKEKILRAFATMSETELENWGTAQSYIALGYLLIAARAMGYDTSPIMGFESEEVKNILDLPRHVAIAALVAIGEVDTPGSAHHRRPLERLLILR